MSPTRRRRRRRRLLRPRRSRRRPPYERLSPTFWVRHRPACCCGASTVSRGLGTDLDSGELRPLGPKGGYALLPLFETWSSSTATMGRASSRQSGRHRRRIWARGPFPSSSVIAASCGAFGRRAAPMAATCCRRHDSRRAPLRSERLARRLRRPRGDVGLDPRNLVVRSRYSTTNRCSLQRV